MKKRFLAVFIAICFVGIFPGALNCQCAVADCHVVPKTIQAKTPQCHHAAAQTGGESRSRKECCGKCRIEKAAVLSTGLSQLSEVRHKNTLASIKFFTDSNAKLQRPFFPSRKFPKLPPGFFTQFILNTTFSFRAPPQG